MNMNHPVKEFFGISELICPHVSAKFGSSSWQFFDHRLLDTVYAVRKYIDKPMIVNNWAVGGTLSQRGLRCNVCQLVKSKTALEKVYLSPHSFGEGVDFHIVGMTANEVRLWICENQVLLPHPIRLEVDFNVAGKSEMTIRSQMNLCKMNWVHLDVRAENQKISFFKG